MFAAPYLVVAFLERHDVRGRGQIHNAQTMCCVHHTNLFLGCANHLLALGMSSCNLRRISTFDILCSQGYENECFDTVPAIWRTHTHQKLSAPNFMYRDQLKYGP